MCDLNPGDTADWADSADSSCVHLYGPGPFRVDRSMVVPKDRRNEFLGTFQFVLISNDKGEVGDQKGPLWFPSELFHVVHRNSNVVTLLTGSTFKRAVQRSR